jgi:hypothetical protein
VLYAYCKYNVACDITKVLTSLLRQLVVRTGELAREHLKLLKECRMEQRSLFLEEILTIFRAEMKRLTCLVIVIDALDECFPYETRQNLLHHMQRLTEEETSMRLFVTSRPHPIIESAITTVSRLQIQASLSDIRFHIATRISSSLSSLRVFLRGDPVLQDVVVQTVVKKASGMCVSNRSCNCGTDIGI